MVGNGTRRWFADPRKRVEAPDRARDVCVSQVTGQIGPSRRVIRRLMIFQCPRLFGPIDQAQIIETDHFRFRPSLDPHRPHIKQEHPWNNDATDATN
jgi:hypothetical protein